MAFIGLPRLALGALLALLLCYTQQAAAMPKYNAVPAFIPFPLRISTKISPPKLSNSGKFMHLISPRILRPKVLEQVGGALLGLRGGSNPIKGAVDIMTRFSSNIGDSKTKCWIILILSICNETGAVTMTKIARDRSDMRLMALAIAMYNLSLIGFAICLAKIDVSIAYAVWSALGTSIVTLAGILLFGEECSLVKLTCLAFIVVGVVGLELLS